MSFPNDRTYSFDANLQFADGAAAQTASGFTQSAGANGILDMGGNQGTSPKQQARIDAMAVIDVTAIDISSGNETYQIDIMVSNDPSFGAGNFVCAGGIQLGKGASLRGPAAQTDSVIGRLELGFATRWPDCCTNMSPSTSPRAEPRHRLRSAASLPCCQSHSMLIHPQKVWHRTDEKGWHVLTMEAVDARHAVDVDPANWAFEKPAEPEMKSDRVALGPHPDQPEPETIVESTVAAFMPGLKEDEA